VYIYSYTIQQQKGDAMTGEDVKQKRLSMKDEFGKTLTQQKFANLIGVSWSTVNRWESPNNDKKPSELAIRAIRNLEG